MDRKTKEELQKELDELKSMLAVVNRYIDIFENLKAMEEKASE